MKRIQTTFTDFIDSAGREPKKRAGMKRRFVFSAAVIAAFLSGTGHAGCAPSDSAYEKQRDRMVSVQIEARGITDRRVTAAMRAVPRHRFVPPGMRSLAYNDHPLPIGDDQTISQPYIVALMTASLDLEGGERILEIGTGSGYQAAVLAEIVDTVFTIEIIASLAQRARATLDTLGYRNIRFRVGDGYDGWPAAAPFDGVIVTAAAPRVPPRLVEQLVVGGRIVIPVGEAYQKLVVYERTAQGLEQVSSTPVRFVPMTGKIRED
jgi:protein-L-isoaspartate(D-aspartate) O-methyltransferase